MHELPRFLATYDIELLDNRLVFLIDDRTEAVLEGDIYCRLAPMLDGEHDLEQILTTLTPEFNATAVYFALNQLDKRGYLTNGPLAAETKLRGLQAYDERVTPAGSLANGDNETGSELAVEVKIVGHTELDDVPALLRNARLRHAADAPILLVLTDDYLHPELRSINAERLANGRPWLLAKPAGIVPWVGPYIVPGHTGCWACMAQRMHSNRQVEQYIRAQRNDESLVTTARVHDKLLSQLSLGLSGDATAKVAPQQGLPATVACRQTGIVGPRPQSDPRTRTYSSPAMQRLWRCQL